MASNAYKNYQKNLVDVGRLIDTHTFESGRTRGKKGLGHLTRSGVVMLCASFEVFIEEIIEEAVEVYLNSFLTINLFPKQTKKFIVEKLKANKNELEILNLTGDGWKQTLRNYVQIDINQLNSPKYQVIDQLMNRYLGIKEFSKSWEFDRNILNDFVSIRGEIAHNGAKAQYVKVKYLKESQSNLTELVKEIDSIVCDQIAIKTDSSNPWRKRY